MNKPILIFFYSLFILVVSATIQPHAAEYAKNIILLIGDGMGSNQMLTYYHYADRIMNQKTEFEALMNDGTTGWMIHTPADELVTDSAAGATAFACGIKTKNKYIAVDADGISYPTLLEIAKRNGKKTGILCNIPPYDATPASFTAHTLSRDHQQEIINQTFKNSQPDIIIGTEYDRIQPAINTLAKENGYTIVDSITSLQDNCNHERIYGVLDMKTPYQDSFQFSGAQTTLSQTTSEVLKIMSQDEDGFFLMIEGAKIDKLGHPNDAASVMREMAEFDKVIGIALTYAKVHKDTLIILTADHETAGMQIVGGDYEHIAVLGKQTKPLQEIQKELGKDPTLEQIQEAFKTHVGVELNETEAQLLLSNWVSPDKVWGKVLSRFNQIDFISNNHTASPVLLAGYGPGSEACNGWRDNTDVFHIIMNASRMVK